MCLVLAVVGSGSRPFYAAAIVAAPSVVRAVVMPPAPCVVQDTCYPVDGHSLLSPQSRPRGTASKRPRRRIRCVIVYIGASLPLSLHSTLGAVGHTSIAAIVVCLHIFVLLLPGPPGTTSTSVGYF